jgi:hypothetical protein
MLTVVCRSLAAKSASNFSISKASAATATQPIPALARVTPRQPIHPAAFLRQSKRWLSTHRQLTQVLRQFSTHVSKASLTEARYGSTRVGAAIKQFPGRAPFASTLRPNLTGGVLPRTAGGYSIGSGRVGNGARYFSHTPQVPAQVIHNVSQGLRAFALGGKKIQYDGTDPKTGEKRFRAVTRLQDKATKKINAVPKATPGSFIDFKVNPTITALTPLRAVMGFQPANDSMDTLHTEGLLDILSVDFSRALKELAIILSDLKALSTLGDLPISYQDSRVRVHFPGCDPETVERLTSELGVRRGIVGQDEDFDAFVGTEIALLFPFAPSESTSQPSLYGMTLYDRNAPIRDDEESSFHDSDPITLSDTGHAYDELDDLISNPWISSPSGYETVPSNELADSEGRWRTNSNERDRDGMSPLEYQDFEGIYRFIELCDNARR